MQPKAQTASILDVTQQSPFTRIATEVEDLSRRYQTAINERDFSNPIFDLAHPKFKGDLDRYPPTSSISQHLQKHMETASANPDFYIEIVRVNTNVHANQDEADVYMLLKISGNPASVERESMCQLKWKRLGGRWMFSQHVSMRGFAGFDLA